MYEQARKTTITPNENEMTQFVVQCIEPRPGNRHGVSERPRSECVTSHRIAQVGGRILT
jgi:hypothetical protein